MKAKRPNAKLSDAKARLRAAEAGIRRRSPRAAASLQQFEELDLRNVSRERWLRLAESARDLHNLQRWRVRNLQDRLGIALARKCLLNLQPLLRKGFGRSAYWRDVVVNRRLDLCYLIAKRDNNKLWMDRINSLKKKWDLADKGKSLGESKIGRRALAFLRKLHFYEEYYYHDRNTEKLKAKLLAQISNASPQFFDALSKAKAFREKRVGPKGMTEEQTPNRRADFMAYGIMCELTGRKENKTWKDVLGEMGPDFWKDDPRNFQKLLRECFYPFKPAGKWDGQQKMCVQTFHKNIHRAR